jgi:hypothetical protein
MMLRLIGSNRRMQDIVEVNIDELMNELMDASLLRVFIIDDGRLIYIVTITDSMIHSL